MLTLQQLLSTTDWSPPL